VSRAEVVLVVGRELSIRGYPSWLIGSAEIGHMEDLDDVDSDLFNALEVYSNSVQRCGA